MAGASHRGGWWWPLRLLPLFLHLLVLLLLPLPPAHAWAAAAAPAPSPAVAQAPASLGASSAARFWVLRFRPGADVLLSLQGFVAAQGLAAASVVSAVGSLTALTLRLANASEATVFNATAGGYATTWEIVSLSGTLEAGGAHVHLAAADGGGRVLGGHLVPGCPVYTTLEVVLGAYEGVAFSRQLDPPPAAGGSGYFELAITPLPAAGAAGWGRADALATAALVVAAAAAAAAVAAARGRGCSPQRRGQAPLASFG
jgi:predicted DNA-binding protein with PD1-like motif